MHSSRSSLDSVMAVWICTQACLKSFRASCQPYGFQPRPWSSAFQCSLDVMTEKWATLRKVQLIHPKKPSQTLAARKKQCLWPPAASLPLSATLGAHRGSSVGGACRVVTGQVSVPWLFHFMYLAFRSSCSCHIASDMQGHYRSARRHSCSSKL